MERKQDWQSVLQKGAALLHGIQTSINRFTARTQNPPNLKRDERSKDNTMTQSH